MRCAILGGSFNPIHVGHLILAQEVLRTTDIERIIFIPAAVPPHKSIIRDVPASERLLMVKASVKGDRRFEVCDHEIQRGGLSYTIDTVAHIMASRRDIDGMLSVIIGDDLIESLSTWHRIDELSRMVNFIVATREDTVEKAKRDMPFPAAYCVMPKIDISSTMLRERLAAGEECRYLIPDGAYRIIKNKGLYRSNK
ncbi:MAG: nicotinate-nucleotide adenylyltransferase [Spirochaetota bacterium]